MSSANVYVKFVSTERIEKGDTLFIMTDSTYTPALEVINKSSISCVCIPVNNAELKVNDRIFAVRREKIEAVEDVPQPAQPLLSDATPKPFQDSLIEQIPAAATKAQEKEDPHKERIRGRISASAHSNFTNSVFQSNQRMRYTFSLRGDNIKGSRFSTNIYLAYRHNIGDNTSINSRTTALRAYNLSLGYRIDDDTDISIGRRINRKMANVGAIDGIQFERRVNNFTFGAVAGSRPDNLDYGFNFDLFEYGGYVAHNAQTKNGYSETTFAVLEMKNGGITDRRFGYFQHSSMLLDDLSMFASFELDLYKNVNEEITTDPRLSSLYLSLRYRFSRKFSVFVSYDARKNIIYYETYKTRVEQLLEEETRQGYRVRINYRPIKYMSIGVSAGYRMQRDNPNESKNLYTYVTYSRIPWIEASMTISMNRLQTGYLDGSIYNARLSRDIKKGVLYGGINYRNVNYTFLNAASALSQHIFGGNLTWRLMKNLSFALFYEGTFEAKEQYNRVHINIIQRF